MSTLIFLFTRLSFELPTSVHSFHDLHLVRHFVARVICIFLAAIKCGTLLGYAS
jgi:hypothetical protein